MSVTLTTPPAAVIFSADLTIAQFTSVSYLDVTGVKSINKRTFFTLPTVGSILNISFGTISIDFTAVSVPDQSGKQITGFGSGSGVDINLGVSVIAENLKKNYLLRSNYDISAVANEIIFAAKKIGKGFDFTTGNVTPGVDEIVKPNYSINFKLFLENATHSGFDKIYEGQLQLLAGQAGVTQVQISDKLHSAIEADLRQLYPEQPVAVYLPCTKSERKYYFEFAESYGETIEIKAVSKSDNYTVLHGGFSTIAQFNKTLLGLIAPSTADNDRFLKQGANVVYTRSNQPQYLYFFNSRGQKIGAKLMVDIEYADGEIEIIEATTFNLNNLRKYAFNVTFDALKVLFKPKPVKKYQIYLKHSADKISETRTYYLDYSARNYVRYFLNWSSFGGFDSRVCYGEGETEFELFNKTAERVRRAGDDIKAGNKITFGSKLTRSHVISTGWLSKPELQLNADFFLSNFKYRYTGGLMLPISVASGKIPEITDGKHLYAQKFEYAYLFEDHAYTEGDAEDNGEIISDFFFSTPSIVFNPSGFTETDPTVPAWVKSITAADILRWNSAANPSDLSNFYNKTEIAAILNGSPSLAGYNKSNWDAAYTWGNHAGLYQPLEDQRLSTTNGVTFKGMHVDTYQSIPTAPPPVEDRVPGRAYLYSSGIGGGGGSIPPTNGYLTGLLDVDPSGLGNGYIMYYDAPSSTFKFMANSFGSVAWTSVTGRPTALSQFTNDLGNYGGFAYAIDLTTGLSGKQEKITSTGYAYFNGTSLIAVTASASNFVRGNGTTADFNGSVRGVILTGLSLTNSVITASDTVLIAFGKTQGQINNKVDLNGVYSNPSFINSLAYSKLTGAPTALSQFTNDLGNYGGFALANGSNASGTWGINISGSAAYLNGYQSDVNPNPNTIVRRTAEGIIFGTYLYMNGPSVDALPISDFVTTAADGYLRRSSVGAVQTKLGLGSFAYRNNIYGSEVLTSIADQSVDIGVAKLLRWKNYGSGHVIFDASAGTAPNGSSISNTNSQNPWQTTYGVLMGWNGVNTFGVRVDSARTADVWGGQTSDFNSEKTTLSSIGAFGLTGGMGYALAPAVRSFIGLPSSGAYDLQWVTDNGNSTTQRIISHSLVGNTGVYVPSGSRVFFDYGVSNNFSIEKSGNNLYFLADASVFSASIQAQRIIAGYDSGFAGSINTNDYLRVSGNGGIFWPSHSIEFNNTDANSDTISLVTNVTASGIKLKTAGNITRGYLYADNGNNIGFLNSGGFWSLRVDNSGNVFATSSFKAPKIEATQALVIPNAPPPVELRESGKSYLYRSA